MTDRNLVATIRIITHGRTSAFDLTDSVKKTFRNTRIYELASQCGPGGTHPFMYRTDTIGRTNRYFQKDIVGTTSDVLNTYANETKSMYKHFDPDLGCEIYDPIPFDKTLAVVETDVPGIGGLEMGIYLVSIHERDIESGKATLVYPLEGHENKEIDLRKISDIETLGEYINNPLIGNIVADLRDTRNKRVLERRVTPRPYAAIHRLLGPEIEPGIDLHARFGADPTYSPYIVDDKFSMIRMSELTDIVKKVLGETTSINFLDYSCAPPRIGMPSEEIKRGIQKQPTPPYNRFGGRRRKKKSTRTKTRRTPRTSKRTRKRNHRKSRGRK
jgi:hypothetical protein